MRVGQWRRRAFRLVGDPCPRKGEAMKKHWLFLVLAAFLVLAPAASADDGSVFLSLESLLGRLVALFSGDGAELGDLYPPHGLTASGDEPELGHQYPPNGVTTSGAEPEIGDDCPPHGLTTGEEPEIGDEFPPGG